MHNNVTKTYACSRAIQSSRKVIINNIIIGITAGKIAIGKYMYIKDQIADVKIFNKMCPDIIFANKRIAKLKIRALYEINSIITKNGTIGKGAPLGKKILKNFKP
jgi:hypothetical protein